MKNINLKYIMHAYLHVCTCIHTQWDSYANICKVKPVNWDPLSIQRPLLRLLVHIFTTSVRYQASEHKQGFLEFPLGEGVHSNPSLVMPEDAAEKLRAPWPLLRILYGTLGTPFRILEYYMQIESLNHGLL